MSIRHNFKLRHYQKTLSDPNMRVAAWLAGMAMVGVDRAGLLRSRREASGPTAAAFRTWDMRKILLSLVALFGMGTAGFAQDTLRGVYSLPDRHGPARASPANQRWRHQTMAPWGAPWTRAPLSRSRGRLVRARNLLTLQIAR
jgi:hypothetical protein